MRESCKRMEKRWHFACFLGGNCHVCFSYCAISAVANLFPTLVILTLTF